MVLLSILNSSIRNLVTVHNLGLIKIKQKVSSISWEHTRLQHTSLVIPTYSYLDHALGKWVNTGMPIPVMGLKTCLMITVKAETPVDGNPTQIPLKRDLTHDRMTCYDYYNNEDFLSYRNSTFDQF